MADEAGRAYITISIDPKSEAKVKIEAASIGRSVADSLNKSVDEKGGFRRGLKDAEKGLIDFNKIGDKVSRDLNTRFGSRSYGFPFLSSVAAGFFNVLGKGAAIFGDVGNAAQKGALQFGTWASEGEQASSEMVLLGTTVSSLAPIFGGAALAVAAFGGALLVLPAIVFAAVTVLVALLDAVTTLVAIFAAFIAPVTLVTALLGGLGAAFAYVASTVLKANVSADAQHTALLKLHIAQQTYNQDVAKYGKNYTTTENALIALRTAQEAYSKTQIGTAIASAHLDDKFKSLIQTLTIRFTPAILGLVHSASQALTFLNKIAQLPLGQAFEQLATKGVRQLSKFVYGVANTISKPISLAVNLAFGTGPGASTTQNVINKWWTSLQRYLFGYSKQHPLITAENVFSAKAKGFQGDQHVKGLTDPITAFFDRHNFTKAGQEMSDDIIGAFLKSNGAKRIGKWVTDTFRHAGGVAAHAFIAVFEGELNALRSWIPTMIGAALTKVTSLVAKTASWIVHNFGQAWVAAARLAGSAFAIAAHAIEHTIGAAFDWIKTKASQVWGSIKALFSGALSLHISFPSIPGDLKSLLSKAGGLLPSIPYVTKATGGLITGGIRGVDSVPAMLTPGEIVMNEPMQKNLLGMLYNPPKGGGGAVEVHVHNYFGSQEMNNLIDTRVELKQRQTKRTVQAGRRAVA